MSCGPGSAARVFVSWTTAALAAPYASGPGAPVSTAPEAIVTMLPPAPWSSMAREASWQAYSTRMESTSSTRSRSSSRVSRMGLLHDPGDRRRHVQPFAGGDGIVEPRAVGDIQGVDEGAAAGRLDPVRRLAQAAGIAVGAVHGGTGPGEQDGRGAADASGGTGDERRAAGEVVRRDGQEGPMRRI